MQVQAGVSIFRQSRERAYWFVCLFVLFEHYRSSKAEMKNFVLRIRDVFCGHPLLNNELNAHFSKKKNKLNLFYLSSIAWGVVAQSPEPGAHVLNARAFRIELEFRSKYRQHVFKIALAHKQTNI